LDFKKFKTQLYLLADLRTGREHSVNWSV